MSGPGISPTLREITFNPENTEDRFCHRNGKTACRYSYQGEKQYTELKFVQKTTQDGTLKIIIGCPHLEDEYGCALMEWCEQQKYLDTEVFTRQVNKKSQ